MRMLMILALLVSSPLCAGGVDYLDVCTVYKIAKKEGMQEVVVKFQSGESVCTDDDGCFAVKYSATVLDGLQGEIGRDVGIVTAADVVLGESYLLFAFKTKGVEPPVITFESRKASRGMAYKIPADVRFFVTQDMMFAKDDGTFYRTFPKGSVCAGSPDCDWIWEHELYSAGAVATVMAPYAGLMEELAACRVEQASPSERADKRGGFFDVEGTLTRAKFVLEDRI